MFSPMIFVYIIEVIFVYFFGEEQDIQRQNIGMALILSFGQGIY